MHFQKKTNKQKSHINYKFKSISIKKSMNKNHGTISMEKPTMPKHIKSFLSQLNVQLSVHTNKR